MAPTINTQSAKVDSSKTSRGRLSEFLLRPRMLLLLAIAVSSTVVIPLVKQSLPDLSQRVEYRFKTSNIEINSAPHWVPPDLVQQVVDCKALPQEVSLLETNLTREIAEAFEIHPWVAEVVCVQKSFPARIQVELQYRRPVAMVQVKQGTYPIDANGVLLPPADFSVAGMSCYPLILNVPSMPQGPAGTSWGDATVIGAARLANVLASTNDGVSLWREFGLAAIRVPRRTKANVNSEELIYDLVTEGGSRIIWGRTPGTRHPEELSADKKIDRLHKYLTAFDGFDHPHGPYEIDIRHWQEITRRPLSLRNSRLLR